MGYHPLTVLCFVVVFLFIPCVLVSSQEADIPIGAASLAFVFDITGSMYDDLVQVIEGAAKILATALSRREKPLYNYVLVPFHDPDIGPYLVTSDPEEFQRELRSLYVQGGGDCPEMSIGAIQLALEVSLPNSFIYVFTDARSKDYYLTEDVLALIQQKQSQVVFVLTGDCGNNTHRGYKAYEEIASTSSGQVFLLKKSDVNQVLNFVRVTVQARKVNLMSVDEDEAKTQTFTIPIDSKLQEITVSVSGENPTIILHNPVGSRLLKRTDKDGFPSEDDFEEESDKLRELLNITNVLIYNVKDPTPGLWKLQIGSLGAHTIRVTGLSTVDFAAGFAKNSIKEFSKTDLRPVKGVPTHVLINTTDMDAPAVLTKLELVDLKGNVLAEFPVLRDPDHPALYNVSSFIPPDNFFYLKVDGIDEEGFVLRRTTPTAISPRIPTAPTVYMSDLTRGFFDQTAVLTCTVHSLVPYSVRWFRDGKQQGYEVNYFDSANATLEIPRAGSNSEGDYYCNATNIAGHAVTKTYLDISDPPPVISKTWNVSVLPGDDAILTCNAYSVVEFNMSWTTPGRFGYGSLDPRIRILSNGSLFIRNAQKKNEGMYICKASNEGGSTEAQVFLRLQGNIGQVK